MGIHGQDHGVHGTIACYIINGISPRGLQYIGVGPSAPGKGILRIPIAPG